MKISKRIITLDEFFRYKEMFSGLPEDQALANELYQKANYADKELLDQLMAKALVFDKRYNFCVAVKHAFKLGSFKTSRLYAFIEAKKVNKVYMDILRKLKNYD